MKKDLSIIIPRYKENTTILTGLLSSIRSQSNVEWEKIEIIIVNDNTEDKISPEWVESVNKLFGIDTKVCDMEENGGPGLARQFGIDNAVGKYVMFCDADDSLYASDGLSRLLAEFIKYPDTDYVSSQWMEEQYDENHLNVFYIDHELENTWMHGKVFNRKFLVNNNIKFHPSLRVHEDSYFLVCASAAAKNRRHVLSKTYIWRSTRSDSITRDNNSSYTFNSFSEFIRAICLGMKWVEENDFEILDWSIVQFMMYCFFNLQKKMWLDESHKKDRQDSIDMFKKEYAVYLDRYKKIDEELIRKVYNDERAAHFQGEIESYTLEEWIKMIS